MFGKRRTEVLVVGAGPVGLLVALRLAERGVKVQIIDKHRRTGVHGYALALHPRTLQLLDQSGLAADLIARGHRIDNVVFMDGERVRVTLPLSKLKEKFPFALVLPQREIESALEARLRVAGVRVNWNHRLQNFQTDGDTVVSEIARLDQAPSGYPVARLEWIISKILSTTSSYLVGADGYHSLVRTQLDLAFKRLAPEETFAVFEFESPFEAGHDVRVLPVPGQAAALWPMGHRRFRFAFQVANPDEFEPTSACLNGLIARRAHWFPAVEGPVHWSTLTRFDRRMAAGFGQGRTWLAGDAAHLTSPLGAQSMNAGLDEAVALAAAIADSLQGGGSSEALKAFDSSRQREWRRLHGLEAIPGALGKDDEWFRAVAGTIRSALPATGDDLECLLRHVEDDVAITPTLGDV